MNMERGGNIGTMWAPALPWPGAKKVSYQVAVARRNAGLLVAFLYLQEIFWLSFSRTKLFFYEPMYQVAAFEWSLFVLYVLVAIFFAIIGFVAASWMRPIGKIAVSAWSIRAFIVVALVLNVVVSLILVDNARYTAGGLTGIKGILYGLCQASSLAAMMLFIRARVNGSPLPRYLLLAFVLSLAVIVDGLAPALTIGVFALLVFDFRVNQPVRVVIVASVALGVLWIGFQAKFHDIPGYLTPEFMVRWVVARFSIPAEQMYTYLAGQSVIGDRVSYIDLIIRAVSDRLDLVLGTPLMIEYPRSVAEALYFDLQGAYGGGSSPGAFLGTALQGPFFFLPPFVFAFLFIQYFYGLQSKITLVQVCAYSFLFKALHANFSEYFTVISPTLLFVAVFLFASLMVPKNELRRERWRVFAHRGRR